MMLNRIAVVCLGGILAAQTVLGGTVRHAEGPLQPVLDRTADGDTVVVASGLHQGNIILSKRVTLTGESGAVLRGSGAGSVVTVRADSCIIRGLTIEHCGRMLVQEDAGILIKSQRNRVEDNDLRDILFGIYLFEAERNEVVGNHVRGRSYLDVGERGSGIHIWNSRYNTFRGNVITDTRDGFYIQNASQTLIEENVAYGVRYGVHYMYADSNVFLRNQFFDNIAGAAIMYSASIRLRHNVFTRNRGFASFGILFQDCTQLEVDSNVVSDNVIGLFLEATRGNLFRHNVIAQNDIALQMFQNSVGNTFTENNFIDNLNLLDIVGKRTESRWGVGGLGNYWSSYDGYDLNADGVGDVPMKIENVFQYMEGRNANVRLYLYSPASQALAVAARAFPVIMVSEEVDAAPLMRPVDLARLPAVADLGATGPERPRTTAPRVIFLVLLVLTAVMLYRYVYRTLASVEKA